MAKKTKIAKKGLLTKTSVETIDLSPMRAHIDGFKKDLMALPEGKQKTNLLAKVEEFYFWSGNYIRDFAAGLSGSVVSANA